jgi:hypothetical protein
VDCHFGFSILDFGLKQPQIVFRLIVSLLTALLRSQFTVQALADGGWRNAGGCLSRNSKLFPADGFWLIAFTLHG